MFFPLISRASIIASANPSWKRKKTRAHCSGHAGKSDLEYAIKAINPDILIPIHTQNPEEFKKIHGDVRIVSRGETVKI